MSIVAVTHGYPPFWSMGCEVSLHRTLISASDKKNVLTGTDKPYEFEGVNVDKVAAAEVLNVRTDPGPIAAQLELLNAKTVIGQNELSLAAVRAAKMINAVSMVNVHTPPQSSRHIADAVYEADYVIYNTKTSAEQWGEPNALVVHPPISKLPRNTYTDGDAYTLLSSLVHKGVEVVLKLAEMYPDRRFIIVRSPSEDRWGAKNFEQRVAKLPNVEVHPRVSPEDVKNYLKETRILLVPSAYETYGMSAIEAAGYGIPSVHVDTPHVREGIGDGAILVKGMDVEETAAAIDIIEKNYDLYSRNARKRAEWLHVRQEIELEKFATLMENAVPLTDKQRAQRQRSIESIIRRVRVGRF